ncbi:MAG: hypothetical protein BGO14_05515 [Chlamydiales bacterium 38-26]|nr:hypothetical protein [Chlamydiales bacterium]OJV07930.1 MAG: hypothetical protein BGO14_05515 [Chlamydiales bacterium 38-26]
MKISNQANSVPHKASETVSKNEKKLTLRRDVVNLNDSQNPINYLLGLSLEMAPKAESKKKLEAAIIESKGGIYKKIEQIRQREIA